MNSEIVVVGCGVNGLTCGLALLQAGYSVRIMADRLPSETVSAIAPAVWFPYEVRPRDLALEWANRTRVKLMELATANPQIGIYSIEMWELYDGVQSSIWWADGVPMFRRLQTDELPAGYVDGVATSVPMIESPVYLPWLMREFVRQGGGISLLDAPLTRLDEVDGAIIVNCTGLGAFDLCDDKDVYPIRGLIARMENPGITRMTETAANGMVTYIIPRRNDVILGGRADHGVWDQSVDEALLADIVARCVVLEPALQRTELIEYRAGLRPGRTVVRLEVERLNANRAIVHNYGHGGAGYTLSWGCAYDVVELVKKELTDE